VGTLAQVSVDPGALDKLAPSAPATGPAEHKAPAHRPPARRAPVRHAVRRPVSPERAEPQHAAKPAPPPKPVTVAPAPPPVPVLPPVVRSQPARPVEPPPVPVVPDAGSSFSVVSGGVRVVFAAGKADLDQSSIDAIRAIAGQVKADPSADINVYAYAAGVPDDPSTPRRLSLARALAARAILINEGIPSTRIYVRALGPNAGDGPPDRVDVIRSGFPQPDVGQPPATPPNTPAGPAK
jgi:outer membrane protein OmpA-like peptidoglycan-associated protein